MQCIPLNYLVVLTSVGSHVCVVSSCCDLTNIVIKHGKNNWENGAVRGQQRYCLQERREKQKCRIGRSLNTNHSPIPQHALKKKNYCSGAGTNNAQLSC